MRIRQLCKRLCNANLKTVIVPITKIIDVIQITKSKFEN